MRIMQLPDGGINLLAQGIAKAHVEEIISDDEVIMDGGLATEVLKDLFGYDGESEDFDTVGGLVMNHLGRLPQVGDEIETGRLKMRVVSMAGRRIRRLRVTRIPGERDESDEPRE